MLANKNFNFVHLNFAELQLSGISAENILHAQIDKSLLLYMLYSCNFIVGFSCSRSTILCVLESDQLYSPGDHLAIYPENDATLVNTILKRIKSNPSSDQPNLSLDENPGPDEPLIIEYRIEAGVLKYTV